MAAFSIISTRNVEVRDDSGWYTRCLPFWLVPWLSGRTSVFDRRAFAVLHNTCSWRVTTYVGKPSAIGQPTRPTQPFILSGSIMSSKVQLDVVTAVRGGASWWTRTKAKGRHGVVCRLNCVIHVWAPWGRDTCHLRRYINPRTFTFIVFSWVFEACQIWLDCHTVVMNARI